MGCSKRRFEHWFAWLVGLNVASQKSCTRQAGDEGRSVDLLATAGTVAEADDVGRVLRQATLERDALGVIDEGDEARLAVVVIAHQNGELASWGEGAGAIADKPLITHKECVERRRA
jgi:hypothetical protein